MAMYASSEPMKEMSFEYQKPEHGYEALDARKPQSDSHDIVRKRDAIETALQSLLLKK